MGKCLLDQTDEGGLDTDLGGSEESVERVLGWNRDILSRKSSSLSTFSTDSQHVFEKTVKIGAFNVRKFGKAKMKDPDVASVLVRIVRRYDILLVQEIADASGKAINKLLELVNEEKDHLYEMVISPRLGRSKIKEQYAFLYKKARFQVTKSKIYDDKLDVFIRDPFVVQLKTSCLKSATHLTLIGVHVQPSNAVKEIDALHDVCAWTRKNFLNKDRSSSVTIILGDFNAGGSYVSGAADWGRIRIRKDAGYRWLIPDHVDTTATNTLAAYDRIVICGEGKRGDGGDSATVPGSAAAFRYDEEWGLGQEVALRVSDHYPVEVDLVARVHPKVAENVTVRRALLLEDKRCRGAEAMVEETFDVEGFDLSLSYDKRGRATEAEAKGQFDSKKGLLEGARRLRQRFPELMSYSVLSALQFHLEDGEQEGGFCMKVISSETLGRTSVTVEFCI